MQDLHIAASPEYLQGRTDERDRIIALMYELLAYYNGLLVAPKSAAFAANMENRKKGIIEAIKLARLTDAQAREAFQKKA